jgi:pyruvate kinase
MSVECDGLTVSTTYPLPVSEGQTIYIADGELACQVKSVNGDIIEVTCLNSYDLKECSTVNLPGIALDIYQPTEKDEMDLKNFVLKFDSQVDFISIPCVRKPEEIQNIKEKLGIQGSHIKILARIENHEGIENYDQILQEADGVIICRKMIGIELPSEKVFIAQKWMTWRANLASKSVIVATSILDTMVNLARCKESEVQDIGNAVIDGVDAI